MTGKWFVIVPFPLPPAMQALLSSMPGWGRGPVLSNHEILSVRRADLRDALVQAGASRLPHHSRSSNALPQAILTATGLSAGGNVSDFLTLAHGDESWLE
jgi:hypothetical protein